MDSTLGGTRGGSSLWHLPAHYLMCIYVETLLETIRHLSYTISVKLRLITNCQGKIKWQDFMVLFTCTVQTFTFYYSVQFTHLSSSCSYTVIYIRIRRVRSSLTSFIHVLYICTLRDTILPFRHASYWFDFKINLFICSHGQWRFDETCCDALSAAVICCILMNESEMGGCRLTIMRRWGKQHWSDKDKIYTKHICLL